MCTKPSQKHFRRIWHSSVMFPADPVSFTLVPMNISSMVINLLFRKSFLTFFSSVQLSSLRVRNTLLVAALMFVSHMTDLIEFTGALSFVSLSSLQADVSKIMAWMTILSDTEKKNKEEKKLQMQLHAISFQQINDQAVSKLCLLQKNSLSVLLLSTTLYGTEYPFGPLGSTVPSVSPPSLLPTPVY